MAQVEEMAAQSSKTASPPPIGKNLFWDDVRIGLNLLSIGVIILVIAALAGPWLPGWLTALIVLAGGIVTVLGVKVCAPIPAESGVSMPALGAFLLAGLCFVTVIISYFLGWPTGGLALSIVLGAVAHVLMALVLVGCLRYLGHRWLGTLAMAYVVIAAIYGGVVALFFLTPLHTILTFQISVQVLTAAVVGLLSYLACGASQALRRAQQGLPVECQPAGETVLDGAPTKMLRADKPPPLPEEFAFSQSDVDGFGAQDSTAGRAIVVLMAGVFSVGVILYTIIAVMAWM
jgi:hypothetical protein